MFRGYLDFSLLVLSFRKRLCAARNPEKSELSHLSAKAEVFSGKIRQNVLSITDSPISSALSPQAVINSFEK